MGPGMKLGIRMVPGIGLGLSSPGTDAWQSPSCEWNIHSDSGFPGPLFLPQHSEPSWHSKQLLSAPYPSLFALELYHGTTLNCAPFGSPLGESQ